MVVPVAVVALVVVGYLLYSRAQELFRVAIRDGKVSVVRGYVPGGLLGDLSSAVRGVKRGTLTAHKTSRGARLGFSGDIDEGVAQRLRNIFGLYPIAKLRAPDIDGRRVVSDAFTIGWLLSLLRSFFR